MNSGTGRYSEVVAIDLVVRSQAVGKREVRALIFQDVIFERFGGKALPVTCAKAHRVRHLAGVSQA